MLPFALLAALVAPEASPSAAPAPPTVAPPSMFCPVSVRLTAIDRTRYAIDFISPDDPQAGSGVVSLYATATRYDVRFEGVNTRRRGFAYPDAGVPVVIRFPQPVELESAVVTSLDAPLPRPCGPLYAPWVARPNAPRSRALNAEDRAREDAYRTRADAATARDAPEPQPYERATCARPFVSPSTVVAVEPQTPRAASGVSGDVQVFVTVGTDGRARRADLWRSVGNPFADRVAVDAARRSQYTPEIYHCVPVAGDYLFTVNFSG